jgi:starch synthase (maltosyl-transferring)
LRLHSHFREETRDLEYHQLGTAMSQTLLPRFRTEDVDFYQELTNLMGPGTLSPTVMHSWKGFRPGIMQPFVPVMVPAPGERFCRFVGDRVVFRLMDREGRPPPKGWRALLRTNLGRATELRREILEAHTRALSTAGSSWRDVPMLRDERGWVLDLPLAEVGYFKAKAYAVDPHGWQRWPEGADLGISVHPDKYRTANTIYCAFTRLFGKTDPLSLSSDKAVRQVVAQLDQAGHAVIPPSGKLRDLTQQLPHIVKNLGCRILHLLPVNPTPTTYARFGRFGSPYAALDLTGIDPALVEFDQRSTGVEQFCELTCAAHCQGVPVFLDIVINHTGWGSLLQERHPEWFLRHPDGRFESPGAWGVTWEDLVELKHENVALWDELSEILLTWCRRGVDGFRCDAGYKVPVPAWQYIVARVQQEFPETLFLLEGLGGAWEATEALLTDGGMHWAYSELFQNYSGVAVAGYLDHCLRQAPRVGLLVHYSETHDNERLAARGRTWSLLRNRLCALTSVSGGFGFTCGVEWLAPEKIRVHDRTSMNWGAADNIIPELAKLNELLADHPCFFDGAALTRISPLDSEVFVLLRESAEGKDRVFVVVNTSETNPGKLSLDPKKLRANPAGTDLDDKGIPTAEWSEWIDLLGQPSPKLDADPTGKLTFHLEPGAAYCLGPSRIPLGLHGDEYRKSRAQAAWALRAMSVARPAEAIPKLDWIELAKAVDRAPARFLEALSSHDAEELSPTFLKDLALPANRRALPQVVLWTALDTRRVTLVPPGHWLLVQDAASFRASLSLVGQATTQNVESIPTSTGQVAFFHPQMATGDATVCLQRDLTEDSQLLGQIRFLPSAPASAHTPVAIASSALAPTDLVLLTNGRGGMARLCVDLGRVNSKYDCVLGANLHPTLPVDRHIFAKRIRVWVNADGFLSPLDFRNLHRFQPGPPARWHFVANAGDGRTVEVQLSAQMLPGCNTTVFAFSRPSAAEAVGKQLPASADVRLTVRLDIEDRNFHWETKRNGGADHHFSTNTRTLAGGAEHVCGTPLAGEGAADASDEPRFAGFIFAPSADRALRVFVDRGCYRPEPEWAENIPHPVEQSRGQVGSGDAFSPGWFDLPLFKGASTTLTVTADPSDSIPLPESATESQQANESFSDRLLNAVKVFVVKRGSGKTVVAGYPWFLDWGRDTFICARGLLAAGMRDEVQQIALTFARFESDGTLPNTIFGEDASNRDTSDAALWFGLVCEELGVDLAALKPTPNRSLCDVLQSIALNYIKGTPNGIRMDPESGLIWSPSHFTWMDTNYPACTPREGYPVEIQALWIRLLRLLSKLSTGKEAESWTNLARQSLASLEKFYWREDAGYYADVLNASRGQPARSAVADDALRSNCLMVISLGLSSGERAQRCVQAARRFLLVPGAMRSLAPLPVSVLLPNRQNEGSLLNDPAFPYWGKYEGDEDTRRKPAYHNGTAWTWTMPGFCEALARAWDFAPAAVAAARAYLGSLDRVMQSGCLGQIPEIMDGDVPHRPRGCDAQAWGATEALRVWKLLQ